MKISCIKNLFTHLADIKTDIKSVSKYFITRPSIQTEQTKRIPYYIPNIGNKDMVKKCKTICAEALNGKNPFEKLFILNANTNAIVKELNGDAQNCYIDKIFFKKDFVKIIHGHTKFKSGATSPVSFQDFKILNTYNKLTEITAVDSQKRTSTLRKKTNFQSLSKSEFEQLKNKYIEYLMKYASEKDRKKIEELQKYCREHKDAYAVRGQIAELLTELQYNENGVKAINHFWKDMAAKLKLEYIPY